MSISKRTRYEVLRRDNHACRYCGGVAPDVVLTVDHVMPVALGGTDDPSNLVAACKDCNAGKSSTSPDAELVQDVSDQAAKWATAMQEAARIAEQKTDARNAYVTAFDAAWCDWGHGAMRTQLPRPTNWRQSVWAWHDAGLPITELQEAVDIAGSNDRITHQDTWRYMCGVAWSKLREIQRVASEIAGGAPDGP